MTAPLSATPPATTPMTAPPSTTGATSTSAATATDKTQLSNQAFMQLLVAQLKYQDPSKPMDTAAFMNQTATLTQVQAMEKSTQANTDMLAAQRAQTASTLVGRTVSYTALDGSVATGYVSAATISTPTPTLRIGGSDVELASVQQVLDTAAPTP
ncbi:flagellar hook capping FlgD N-terminal domain-containing protein [Rhodococcus sp. X156]|uniref:flagellar hook assembly protein FlgD n=1 Tax=Rhodococcus sp. X156 TaxID=2499145 RepID=UPI0019D1F1E5|nr:flagellar hook capping FlgD N-terminal domain-containing protein [Rhodococcus sp. X156]